jgi:hypothetical protein
MQRLLFVLPSPLQLIAQNKMAGMMGVMFQYVRKNKKRNNAGRINVTKRLYISLQQIYINTYAKH